MGGKSRKSGGVSKQLIALIRSGAYSSGEGKTTKCGGKSEKDKTTRPPLFDEVEEPERRT